MEQGVCSRWWWALYSACSRDDVRECASCAGRESDVPGQGVSVCFPAEKNASSVSLV